MRHLDIQIASVHLHENKISICTDSENGPLAFSCASENPDCWAEEPEKKDLQLLIQRNSLGKVTSWIPSWAVTSPPQGEESKSKKYAWCLLLCSGLKMSASQLWKVLWQREYRKQFRHSWGSETASFKEGQKAPPYIKTSLSQSNITGVTLLQN